MRHRLDAQSVLRAVTKFGPHESWLAEERQAFNRYRGITPKDPQLESPVTDLDPVDDDDASLDDLADKILIDVSHLRKIERLLEDKKQVIFFGPPGTGKTFLARELAAFFAGDGERVRLVQFHPSYAYEDFVEGYRPSNQDGIGTFRLVNGPLKEIADRALQDQTYVLIIDEINRGNVAKVLGELYFLLEYRDEDITLQYSSEPFRLPENLWIIGTMNTADRSIALVDAALRRRFFFVGFFPDQEPIAGLLRRWLERNNPGMLWVADVLDEANRRLKDRDVAIGPSHFMRSSLDEVWVETIWEHQIEPYLAEHFFGEADQLDQFKLENLRHQLAPETAAGTVSDSE